MGSSNESAKHYMALPYTIRMQNLGEGGWYAEIEELQGCIAAVDTRDEVLELLDEAMES